MSYDHKRKAASDGIDDTEVAPKRQEIHTDDQPISVAQFNARETEASDASASFGSGGHFSEVSRNMMANMGYRGGAIGKSMPGLVEPIIPTMKLGRSGLGADSIEGSQQQFEARDATVDSSEWIFPLPQPPPCPFLSQTDGPEMASITSSPICDSAILDDIMKAKTELDPLTDKHRFRDARSRANPFELIDRSLFQNRAALKMAELDHLFPLTRQQLLKEENDVLFFVDICAGPGGFTEYVYWRRRWRAKGWGMTLAGKQDFQLQKFNLESPSETFDALYGPANNGDITNEDNLRALQKAIYDGTEGRGAALMMADGGVSVDGDWNRQEITTKQLLLGQFVAALMCLRKGGTFVCKFFDNFTPFTFSLIYVMCCNFEEVCISKPVQSRPANSERYLVCQRLKQPNVPGATSGTAHQLLMVNRRLHDRARSKRDIIDLVPMSMMEESGFITAIRTATEKIARRQVVALQDLRKYYLDPSLRPPADQADVRDRALALWDVPMKCSESAHIFNRSAEEILNEFHVPRDTRFDFISSERVKKLQSGQVTDTVVCELSTGKLGLLIGLRRSRAAWICNGIETPFEEIRLPRGTILLAEFIEGAVPAFLLIDAFALACKLLDGMSYRERHKAVTELVTALPISDAAKVHVHDIWAPTDAVSGRFKWSSGRKCWQYRPQNGDDSWDSLGLLFIHDRSQFALSTGACLRWTRPSLRVSYFTARMSTSGDQVRLMSSEGAVQPPEFVSSSRSDELRNLLRSSTAVIACVFPPDRKKWCFMYAGDEHDRPSAMAEIEQHRAQVLENMDEKFVMR